MTRSVAHADVGRALLAQQVQQLVAQPATRPTAGSRRARAPAAAGAKCARNSS